ncbi:MAG: Bug family tripartite tricarboxylate transporter substrate binding protein [Candidatus Hydrothermarchaeales archaeon]
MKKLSIVSLIGLFIFTGILFGFLSQVSAQDFPKKNIRWVVPYKPGGGFDTYSRAISRTMKKYLPKGVNVIVMNKPGAGGQVATSLIYKAKPDGYTVGILPMPGLYVPQMFYKTKYDVKKITWLGTVLNEPMVFALASSSKFKTLEEVRRAESFRICGTGFTGPEIVAPITMETLGIKAKFITGHSGSKEAILAAMRGDGDAVVFSYGTTRKHVLDKSFKGLLLIGAQKRSPEMPDVPTAVELGYPKLGLLGTYRVIGAPPGLPKDRDNYLGDVLLKSLNDPEFQEWTKKAKRPVTPMDGSTTKKTLLEVISLYDKDYRGLLEQYFKK